MTGRTLPVEETVLTWRGEIVTRVRGARSPEERGMRASLALSALVHAAFLLTMAMTPAVEDVRSSRRSPSLPPAVQVVRVETQQRAHVAAESEADRPPEAPASIEAPAEVEAPPAATVAETPQGVEADPKPARRRRTARGTGDAAGRTVAGAAEVGAAPEPVAVVAAPGRRRFGMGGGGIGGGQGGSLPAARQGSASGSARGVVVAGSALGGATRPAVPPLPPPRKLASVHVGGGTGDDTVLATPLIGKPRGSGREFRVTVTPRGGRWRLVSRAGCHVEPRVVEGPHVIDARVTCAASVSNPKVVAERG